MFVLNRKVLYSIVTLVVLLEPGSASAWFFGPSNYDECVRKYTKNTESSTAVDVITYACDKKFNKKIDSDYADCVFNYVPGNVSDTAARVITYACVDKYIDNKYINYANCILDEVPGVKTDRAATVLTYSCKHRYQ